VATRPPPGCIGNGEEEIDPGLEKRQATVRRQQSPAHQPGSPLDRNGRSLSHFRWSATPSRTATGATSRDRCSRPGGGLRGALAKGKLFALCSDAAAPAEAFEAHPYQPTHTEALRSVPNHPPGPSRFRGAGDASPDRSLSPRTVWGSYTWRGTYSSGSASRPPGRAAPYLLTPIPPVSPKIPFLKTKLTRVGLQFLPRGLPEGGSG